MVIRFYKNPRRRPPLILPHRNAGAHAIPPHHPPRRPPQLTAPNSRPQAARPTRQLRHHSAPPHAPPHPGLRCLSAQSPPAGSADAISLLLPTAPPPHARNLTAYPSCWRNRPRRAHQIRYIIFPHSAVCHGAGHPLPPGSQRGAGTALPPSAAGSLPPRKSRYPTALSRRPPQLNAENFAPG